MTEEKKIEIKNKRKKVYKKLLIFVIPIFVIFLVLGYFAFKNVSSLIDSLANPDSSSAEYSGAIEEYGYYLRKNATDYQKELFKELQNTCNDENATDEQIVELVAKNYVADMYTWTNKAGSYDVGGICYVYLNHRYQISLLARDTFYKYLSNYIDMYGSENLLEVESVEITSLVPYGKEYTYHDDDHTQKDGIWSVVAEWHYVDKTGFSDKEYLTWTYMTIAKRENGRIEILESYADE